MTGIDFEKKTGEIIRKTIYLQVQASKVISRYYLKNNPREDHINFIHNVMTDPLSSFSFVKNVLVKILTTENIDKKEVNILKDSMRRLGEIRNTFAHEIVITNESQNPGKLYHPNRKKFPGRKIWMV